MSIRLLVFLKNGLHLTLKQKSNPLSEEEKRSSSSSSSHNMEGWKKHKVFNERLRAEHESFRAVFDKRRHRIGGLAAEDD